MKKLFIVLSVICALALGGGVYSYAYVPNTCSSVSGASVSGAYSSNNPDYYIVTLSNRSGSRCSASFTVEGKTGGVWESLGDGILTASHNGYEKQSFYVKGYDNVRVTNISTWRCD